MGRESEHNRQAYRCCMLGQLCVGGTTEELTEEGLQLAVEAVDKLTTTSDCSVTDHLVLVVGRCTHV